MWSLRNQNYDNLLFSVASSNKFERKSRTEVANIANKTAYNVSKLLDNLLQEYDNSLRLDFVVVVTTWK